MYEVVEIPHFVKDRSFDSFSKGEAKEYFEWFMRIKNERIAYLAREIQGDNELFKNDFSRCSLIELNKWLVKKTSFQNRNQIEFDEQMLKTPLLKNAIRRPKYTIANATVSMIFDIGIYLGETIINADRHKRWGYLLKPKSYVHYGQPIILAEHPADNLNPRFLIETTILFSVNQKEELPDNFLVKVYDYSVAN